jgi:hypothetical protein
MDTQPKISNGIVRLGALTLIAMTALSAHAADEEQRRWKTTPDDHAQRRALMTSSGNSSAMLFAPGVRTEGSFYTYERDLAPEFDRRDSQLSLSVPDATAGWYAWPTPARPTLNDRDYFSTSRNPNTFVFPGTGGVSSYDQNRREIRRDRILENQKNIYIFRKGVHGTRSNRNRVR